MTYAQQILSKAGLEYLADGDVLHFQCPENHPSVLGTAKAHFSFDLRTGQGECHFSGCNKKLTLETLVEAFKVPPPAAAQAVVLQKPAPPPGIKPPQPQRKLRVWSVGEIFDTDFGDATWLVDNLIPLPGAAILSGDPGIGKTWITLEIAKSVATGTAAFGKFASRQRGVLIVDEENHLRHIQKRIDLMGILNSDPVFYSSQNGINIVDESVAKELLAICQEKGVGLMILDSLIRIHRGDENSARDMARVFEALQPFIKADISVLITHHNRKQSEFRPNNPSQEMRGSSDILAAVDSHLQLYRKSGEPDALMLAQTKSRQAAATPRFEIKISRDEHGSPRAFEYAGESKTEPKAPKSQKAAEAIAAFAIQKGVASRQDIHDALRGSYGKTALDDGIQAAIAEGKLEEIPRDGLSVGYSKRQKHYRTPSLPESFGEVF